MLDKVIKYIDRYEMLNEGEGIVVGLSGGPDSVCLLHLLWRLRERYGIKLYAVHLNHMIRGEEAKRDERYAEEFSKSLNIPFYSRRIAVEEYARENKLSSEEAGRLLRYNLFNEIAKKTGATKIALAHNTNDQAETMIMRFLRGSGISGLKGISPVREGRYIRPILGCTRQEIEGYCSEYALNPMIDSTNSENIYTRNRVRLEIIPYIRKHFNPNIIQNLFNNAEIMRDEDEYLILTSRRDLERLKGEKGVDIAGFNSLHVSIKRRIMRILIGEAKGDLNQIESKHIEECIDFIKKSGTGKSLQLPKGLECKIEYGIFRVDEIEVPETFEKVIEVPGITLLDNKGIEIKTRLLASPLENLSETKFIKYFDYDKIKGSLTIRNRQDGDYLYPKGMQGRKKLKEIFIDKKIPKEDRDNMPLIALGSEILWAVSMRDTRNYKVDENTDRILEINFERGAYIEGGNKGNTTR